MPKPSVHQADTGRRMQTSKHVEGREGFSDAPDHLHRARSLLSDKGGSVIRP